MAYCGNCFCCAGHFCTTNCTVNYYIVGAVVYTVSCVFVFNYFLTCCVAGCGNCFCLAGHFCTTEYTVFNYVVGTVVYTIRCLFVFNYCLTIAFVRCMLCNYKVSTDSFNCYVLTCIVDSFNYCESYRVCTNSCISLRSKVNIEEVISTCIIFCAGVLNKDCDYAVSYAVVRLIEIKYAGVNKCNIKCVCIISDLKSESPDTGVILNRYSNCMTCILIYVCKSINNNCCKLSECFCGNCFATLVTYNCYVTFRINCRLNSCSCCVCVCARTNYYCTVKFNYLNVSAVCVDYFVNCYVEVNCAFCICVEYNVEESAVACNVSHVSSLDEYCNYAISDAIVFTSCYCEETGLKACDLSTCNCNFDTCSPDTVVVLNRNGNLNYVLNLSCCISYADCCELRKSYLIK